MKKLGLALGLSALVALAGSSAALARLVDASGVLGFRNPAIVHWPGGTNARLVYINERLYPDTVMTSPIDNENATIDFAFGMDSATTSSTTSKTTETVEPIYVIPTEFEWMDPAYVPGFSHLPQSAPDAGAAAATIVTLCADSGCLVP